MKQAAVTDHNAYVRREVLISMTINSVLSLLFFILIFHGQNPVQVWGSGQWVFDFIPQSFIIAAMSTVVPGAIAAKKIASGRLMSASRGTRLPRNLIIRAVLAGSISVIAGGGAVAIVALAFGIDTIPSTIAGLLKVTYGALLALIVTPICLRVALSNNA